MSDANTQSNGLDEKTLALLKSMKAMPGGKRKSKKGSKKGSHKLELEGGKRKSKKGSKKGSHKLDLEGGKRKSKKGSKKGSKKLNLELDGGKRKSKKGSSKKGSRKMKREMPKPMQDVLNIKSKIKSDDSSIKDGIPLTTLVWKMYKENDLQVAKTVAAYMSDKSGFAKKLQAVAKEQEAKRAAKKANK
jgi:hypothetical protein